MLGFIQRFERRVEQLIADKGVAGFFAILLALLLTVALKASLGS